MRAHRIVLALLCALVPLTVTAEASSGGGTPISSCGQTVTTNAFLTQDLYCPGSRGVWVGASVSTIDLRGFTLRGDRTALAYGVDDSAGYGKVTVKNGVVRDFADGVVGNGADFFTTSNVAAVGNVQIGIAIAGASASVKSST